MIYKTDLMDQILTSEEAKRITDLISPVYGNAYVNLWMFQVQGYQLDDIQALIEDFMAQVVPDTATWSLPYWESEYGIPTDDSLTTEQRRTNVINKCFQHLPMNPTRFGNILTDSIGADITIKENTSTNKFTVYVTSREYLIDAELLDRLIKKLKPSHLIYNIVYQNTVSSTLYTGGVIQKYKEITLREG